MMKKIYTNTINTVLFLCLHLEFEIGIYTKNYPFIIVGIILFALTFYVAKIEKEEEKKKAERDAERKALKAQQKRLNKGKKKKKKKKR